MAVEHAADVTDPPATGRGLADVLLAATSRFGSSREAGGAIHPDLNGETFRAIDWGNALLHVLPTIALDGWPQRITALNFGDTGGATGALGLCLATRAFVRRYAPGESAVILVAGEDGTRSALTLSGPGR